MEEIIYQKSFTEYREELTKELTKTAEGFVRIGYLLKVARDTDILEGKGYDGYIDFALKEFGQNARLRRSSSRRRRRSRP